MKPKEGESTFSIPETMISDSEITFAIEDRFQSDEGVATQRVEVETVDGIVTLWGSIDNILSKERSIEIAKSTRGVRAVIDEVNVVPSALPDERIKHDVEQALAKDPATRSQPVTVKVDDGIVTLDGEVGSWQEKQLCAEVTKGVHGVVGVASTIHVKDFASRTDKEIKADIESRFHHDIWLEDAWLDILVEDGKVILSGTVGSVAEKSRAYASSWVRGVKAVDNDRVRVEPWARDEMRRDVGIPSKTDQEIKKAIKDALFYDPRVLSPEIVVDVEDGVVTLGGVVDNLQAKMAVGRDAQDTIGVKRTKNYLRVRSEETPSDAEITDHLLEALARDPIVSRHEITVRVINGKAYLSGMVDTTHEKKHVDSVVGRIEGVADIQNNLSVPSGAPPVHHAWPEKADEEIREDIIKAFVWDPFVDSSKITVNVEHGIATLIGTVTNRMERGAAEDDATRAGPREIRNRLEIRSNK